MIAIFTFSTGIAAVTGFNPIIVTGVVTLSTLVTPAIQGVAFEGLNKEIWIPEILEKPIPDGSFLLEATDMSHLVEYDKINMAEAGVDPEVLKNNVVYPVPMAERTDNPIELTLDYYDTKNTVVRNAELAELAYDKRASVMKGHKNSFFKFALLDAAYNWTPDSNTANTPVLTASGPVNRWGFKSLSFEDILDLDSLYDELELEGSRNLVLSNMHKADLKKEDKHLYKQVFSDKKFGSFKLHTLSKARLPRFNKDTGVKVAYGAAPAATDTHCSFAFDGDKVMRAEGSADMFARLKDPEARGDIIGFQKRALYMPIQNFGAAIYSK